MLTGKRYCTPYCPAIQPRSKKKTHKRNLDFNAGEIIHTWRGTRESLWNNPKKFYYSLTSPRWTWPQMTKTDIFFYLFSKKKKKKNSTSWSGPSFHHPSSILVDLFPCRASKNRPHLTFCSATQSHWVGASPGHSPVVFSASGPWPSPVHDWVSHMM